MGFVCVAGADGDGGAGGGEVEQSRVYSGVVARSGVRGSGSVRLRGIGRRR